MWVVTGTLCDSGSRVDRENKQSRISCPIEAHRRSAIYKNRGREQNEPTPKKGCCTSSALNITYSLMVSWPRMKWYILLASVRGYRIAMVVMSSNVRRISAFCEGGSGGADRENRFRKSRNIAKTNRIGKTVNVWRNESKQRMKPKPMICKKEKHRQSRQLCLKESDKGALSP